MKRIFVIDWLLLLAFVASAVTGVGLHLSAERGLAHDIWHNWAVAHIASSAMYLGFGIAHIRMHRVWYKALFRKRLKNRNTVTILTTIAYALATATGLALLLIEGANSGTGKWHWAIGLALTATSALHIIAHLTPLLKSLKK